METGIKGHGECRVTENNTALAMGSGTLRVFATPAMTALMERTSWESVAPFLDKGKGTVGISLNIEHISATPVGMKVYCDSELVKIQGKKLTFSVKVFDEAGLIGKGVHERFIVSDDEFQAKARDKMKNRQKACQAH